MLDESNGSSGCVNMGFAPTSGSKVDQQQVSSGRPACTEGHRCASSLILRDMQLPQACQAREMPTSRLPLWEGLLPQYQTPTVAFWLSRTARQAWHEVQGPVTGQQSHTGRLHCRRPQQPSKPSRKACLGTRLRDNIATQIGCLGEVHSSPDPNPEGVPWPVYASGRR